MPLYNRSDMELELELIDQASAMLSRKVVAGEITGLKCVELDAKLEYLRRKAKGKLFQSSQRISDIRAAEKNLRERRNDSSPYQVAVWDGERERVETMPASKAAGYMLGKAIRATKTPQSPFRVKES